MTRTRAATLFILVAWGGPGCAAAESWDQFSRGGVGDGDAAPGDAAPEDARAVADAGDAAAADAGPPIASVQSNSLAFESASRSSVDVPFPGAQIAGDLNVVAVGWFAAGPTVTSVTDTRGNTYRLAIGPTTSGAADPIAQSIYYASNVAASAAGANTVTIAWDSEAEAPDVRVIEYSGLDPRNPLDVTTGNSGTDASPTSLAVTTHHTRELLVAAGTSESSFTVAGPLFTVRIITTEDALVEDRSVDAIGSYAATAPLTNAKTWVMQMATFW